jgi:hypothetical protein
MVKNLAESPGMCSDGPGSAPIKISKREAFSLRGSKKERKEMTSCGLGRRKESTGLSLRVLGPTSARHTRTVCDATADSPRGARTVRHPGADGPLFAPEHPELPLSPSSRANSPRRPGGRSSRSGRTVQPTAADRPAFLFFFSLIYSEIKI